MQPPAPIDPSSIFQRVPGSFQTKIENNGGLETLSGVVASKTEEVYLRELRMADAALRLAVAYLEKLRAGKKVDVLDVISTCRAINAGLLRRSGPAPRGVRRERLSPSGNQPPG